MPETPAARETLHDLALEVRSKNAGPFWTTLELFMRDEAGYAAAADPAFLNEEVVARLYRVPADQVRVFRIPALNVVKIAFPRPVAQGGLGDRDVHSGQQHVPLALLVPPAAGARSPKAGA
ncbi:DUF4387 domain-containing protein [Streptomonospora nanhaiensis]|uniref:DUF4387 domain-containing protein n=1 Tax=Streptomonospora nanhaiensis TaxID=1323731 RepID=A0A853BRH8_9ACTN|nr:DUF4387 domain-containing protein [Streptomonospora nanhaiensis]MBV2366505.1 DUF4387 domain-containing protein [Streptomonospora nanhaiensis]MBX9391468.1 DUF4387 domain-containing protein [Streptomonospora nanhaiensis]NYI98349.1 hypothetical protein [Streptomonospora nanhaiensis]